MKTCVSIFLLLLTVTTARAHQNSTAYLSLDLSGHTLKGTWEIPVRDLEFAVGLDSNTDGQVTWGEIRERVPAIRDYCLARLALHGATPPLFKDLLVNHRPAGTMLVFFWQAEITNRTDLALEYRFGFDYDAGYQCMLTFNGSTSVLTSEKRTFQIGASSDNPAFRNFIELGVFHIFAGVDHICFLIALILPAVWRRTPSGWETIGCFRTALRSTAEIVTAFTMAHSITLAVGALRLVVLPSTLVESVIALSVAVAAFNNIWPLWTERSWRVAFGFGLVHGFGFASGLADLPSRTASLLNSLAGFNLGVECGQLCIVLLFLPLAFALRDSWFYRWCAFRVGSIAIACIATVWVVERALHLTIF